MEAEEQRACYSPNKFIPIVNSLTIPDYLINSHTKQFA